MSRASDLMGASAPAWTSGKTYYPGDVLKSPADNYMPYVRVTAAGAGATDPASDSTNYKPFGARAIKSIQRGTISIGGGDAVIVGTATISAVNTAKSQLRHMGSVSGGALTDVVRLALTNATTVTASRSTAWDASGTNGGALTSVVSWELTEYY